MNQKMYEIKTLLNVAGCTNATTGLGTYTLLLPSAMLSRREAKVIVGYQILTAGTFPITLTECNTSNGTFTAVDGDSITDVTGTQAGVGLAEYHVKPTKSYMKAQVGTVAGASATANLLVLIQNLKRAA